MDGFNILFENINSVTDNLENVKFQSTPLHTNLYRKGLSLRKTKSDLHLKDMYALLSQYPSASQIANVHLTKLYEPTLCQL